MSNSPANQAAGIDRLIINSPYTEPTQHWSYDRRFRRFQLKQGRRKAGYLIATPDSISFDDPGVFQEIELANKIRPRVAQWREADYPGVTSITKRLLEHWRERESEDDKRLFFCQLEAAETLIWLTEAPESAKVGIDIPTDGGKFSRVCSKMATGSGKTVVMAMLIAWHILNKVAHPQDPRFAKNVLVVAPGLTVRSRLAVLDPQNHNNYFEEFDIVPSESRARLRQGQVIIRNWHALTWQTAEQLAKKRGVDRRGPLSDEAYLRDVLEEMAKAKNLVVINDEAHHAWRVPVGATASDYGDYDKSDLDEATKWVEGLDRIHKARQILKCYDFSATPFVPTGKKNVEEALFGWIVSDFSLNDAIESGLVKTPRVVVRDDAGVDPTTYRSRLYHIYNAPEVKTDLNRAAREQEPLPDLVAAGYSLLGHDWQLTHKAWQEQGHPTPPVMITVANRTHTAARVKHFFDVRHPAVGELPDLCDPDLTLHIDSKVLKKAEDSEAPIAELPTDQTSENYTVNQQTELLRRQVDTIGQQNEPGEQIRHVISVQMLSEGWDAKTVTHIMGLRAFTSQLLCEQVVGRGLRRTSYEVNKDGLFEPEYVNIFGVPFTFLPHENQGDGPLPPPKPKTEIFPDPAKAKFEISFPNVIRIDAILTPTLLVDWEQVEPLSLEITPTLVQLAATIEGKPDEQSLWLIELEKCDRRQSLVFQAARLACLDMQDEWRGRTELLAVQLVRLAEGFISSGRIEFPGLWNQLPERQQIVLLHNINKVVQHITQAVRFENTERLELVLDTERPHRRTGDMGRWFTGKACGSAKRSHINYCVYDSNFEQRVAQELDRHPNIHSWVKNDHLGFDVFYRHKGVVRKYVPDFLVRLVSGKMLVLEVKGELDEVASVKRKYLQEWTQAVTASGNYGIWEEAIVLPDTDLDEILSA